MNKFKFGYALAAVFAVQFILIGGMLFDRIYTIRTGQEVLLQRKEQRNLKTSGTKTSLVWCWPWMAKEVA